MMPEQLLHQCAEQPGRHYKGYGSPRVSLPFVGTWHLSLRAEGGGCETPLCIQTVMSSPVIKSTQRCGSSILSRFPVIRFPLTQAPVKDRLQYGDWDTDRSADRCAARSCDWPYA